MKKYSVYYNQKRSPEYRGDTFLGDEQCFLDRTGGIVSDKSGERHSIRTSAVGIGGRHGS